jgi:hypothetical protein
LDLLAAKAAFNSRSTEERQQQRKMLMSLIDHHCPARRTVNEVADKRLNSTMKLAQAQ